MNEIAYDCVVAGAGISGITFACRARAAGKTVILLEKEPRPGGRLRTLVTRDGEFRLEAGAHACYNGYTSLLAIARELGLGGEARRLERLPYLLDAGDRLKGILSGVPLASLCLNVARGLFTTREGKSVEEYYRRVAGSRAYDRFFSRAFRAVICQEAGEYPAGLLLKRRKTRDDAFPGKYSFAGGMQALAGGIVERAALPLVTGAAVTAIRHDGPGAYIVENATGATFRARAVALAVDPPSAAALLRDVEPDVAALLATVPVARVESLAIVVERGATTAPPFSGIIPRDDDFLSVVSADPLGQPRYRGFTLHFKQGERSPAGQLDTATRLLGIPRDAILESAIARHVLPSPRVEHLDISSRLAAATRRPGLYLLGNYFHGLSIEDCVNRSREEAARLAGQG